ncbi:RNA polymerase sigma factor [Dysgonomonas alginatilytica]|uniref:RNA polymerase sigma factor n=1 Tax=Dysgonomonas alginatilytica TaxID=1605892 RepID=UPI001FE39631|nr:sigma-70 family RNA polymerase sigma factor [Dysgonomonas alginatilytica]
MTLIRHTGMTSFDDIHYVRLIKDGDTNAFVHIVRRYQRMVYTIVSKIVTNTEDAEDITQEIFIKIYQSLSKFRGDSEFSTWIYRIAYNTAITEVRKTKREFISFDDMAEKLPDAEISDSLDELNTEERLEYLDIVIKRLNPEDALLITLFYLNNHSVQDISTISNLSQANVKVKLYRIRKFMNSEINKLIST